MHDGSGERERQGEQTDQQRNGLGHDRIMTAAEPPLLAPFTQPDQQQDGREDESPPGQEIGADADEADRHAPDV